MTSTFLFFYSLFSAFFYIWIFSRLAVKLELMDRPNYRKKHASAVPLVGGVSVYAVILSTLGFVDLPNEFIWLILSGGIVVITGMLDDAFDLRVLARFASQILASSLMIAGASLWIQSLGLEFWGMESLRSWFGVAITVFATVGLTNGFNMIDGIDGLAAGQLLISLGSLFLALFVFVGVVDYPDWIIVFAAAVFAFFLTNLSLTPLKPVFLGDAGSLFLGFTLGWILIYFTQKAPSALHPVAALWCVTIPVFDTLTTIVTRLHKKVSPFVSDRNHLHYLLIDVGLGPRGALIVILTASALLNGFGIWITYEISSLTSVISYGVLLIGFAFLRVGKAPPRLNENN